MILDHISRAEKYYHVHPNFRRSFDYLKQHDIAIMENGRHEIDHDNIFIIIARGSSTDTPPKLECHKKYIDIQITLDGSFPVGWKNIDCCADGHTDYDSEKDVQLFNDSSDFSVELTQGMFAVLFPEDAHVGLPPKNSVLKAIVKVAV